MLLLNARSIININKWLELESYVKMVIQLKGSVKEPNMFHNYETEKITRKASDAAENLHL